jgi:peptidoglycan/xylan/chitin deacetylase (PgdA/CDA1 family)
MVAATGLKRSGCRFPYFHRLGDRPISNLITGTSEFHTVSQFERFVAWFVNRYTAISPREWVAYNSGGSEPPANAAILSFDDGYIDNYQLAIPILDRYGVRATFFVISSYVDGDGGMSSTQLRKMHALGHTIGAHGETHKPLAELSPYTAREELLLAREKLEDILGVACIHMSYPFGSFNKVVMDLVAEAGYETAFTTREFGNQRNTDLLQLGRTKIWPSDDSDLAYSVRMQGIHEWRHS